jgi:hypothetical protein
MDDIEAKKEFSGTPAPRNIDGLSLERLREVLTYNPETGVFMWRFRTSPMCKLDQPAGMIKMCGYRRITIDGRSYLASHLAWLHHYGEPPAATVDHRNRDRTDDRIENLRLATHSEQCRNRETAVGTTGLKGVSRFNKPDQHAKFRSTISVNGKRIFLGLFMTAEEAHAAYCRASEMHGEFAHTGSPEGQPMSDKDFSLYSQLDSKSRMENDPTKRMQIEITMAMLREKVPPQYLARQVELMATAI